MAQIPDAKPPSPYLSCPEVVLQEGSETIDIRIKGLGFDRLVSEIKAVAEGLSGA